MKVLIKSAWGSDDPTRACFAFLHANAFAEAGHEVRIFLLGEAVNLMKDELISAVTPVGWPPLSEIMRKQLSTRFRSACELRVHGPVRFATPISKARTLSL